MSNKPPVSADNETSLSDELNAFCQREKLPPMCAFELMHEDGLTEQQRAWLVDFCRRWDEVAGHE